MKKYVLSLDQGTTSSRAILFDQDQKIIATKQQEFAQLFPNEGWVEHNPMDIYNSQCAVLLNLVSSSNVDPADIAAIGITNQRETTILWDKKTGLPVYNAIVWQCRRTADICEDLKEKGLAEYIKKNTGLVVDAYFSGTKIKWILDNVPGLRKRAENGEILFGTVDTWILWNLTNEKVHITDYSNASRTMLFNIHTLDWDDKLLHELQIPREILPEVRPSSEIYGHTTIQGVDIPIAGIAGDQQAALFGQKCFKKGQAKNTYGTGCFFLMNTGDQPVYSNSNLITTIAASIDKNNVQYALEGSVFVGGAIIQWLRDEMRFFSESCDSEYFAKKVKDTGGVYVVPAFTGLGAPYWDMYARGCIVGLTRGTKREHIIRASQESIAYQSLEIVRCIETDTDIKLKELRVDGGASRDAFLMQFQADILGISIKRPTIKETTALGAAYLAGLATGVWNDTEQLESSHEVETEFTPDMTDDVRKSLIKGWKKAVSRSLNWAE